MSFLNSTFHLPLANFHSWLCGSSLINQLCRGSSSQYLNNKTLHKRFKSTHFLLQGTGISANAKKLIVKVLVTFTIILDYRLMLFLNSTVIYSANLHTWLCCSTSISQLSRGSSSQYLIYKTLHKRVKPTHFLLHGTEISANSKTIFHKSARYFQRLAWIRESCGSSNNTRNSSLPTCLYPKLYSDEINGSRD